MGRYRQQYLYRCPSRNCRNAVVEPPALPAAAAIDWADLGSRIGDRLRPMREATRARIAAGLARYARPVVLEAAGHTFERRPGVRTWPADTAPLTAQTTTASKALACPPLLVPAGGTWRGRGQDGARPVTEPMPTRTVRENDGIAVALAALAESSIVVRQNTPRGDPGQMATPATEPLRTLTTTGHQSLASWAHLLVPYYGNAAEARPAAIPVGTLTARDRYGLASGPGGIDVDDVLFRMLKPGEIGRAMAFADAYVVLGTQREKVRQLGNAVTPPVAEVLIRALVEAIAPETAKEAA